MVFYYLKKTSSEDCQYLLIIFILMIFIVFRFFKQQRGGNRNEKFSNVPGNVYETTGKLTPPYFEGLCSPQCCLNTQWPVDFMDDGKDYSAYEPTGMHCRGCEGTGCLCMPKKKTN
jgi:hypothetical protein